jgi:hypothetical protein
MSDELRDRLARVDPMAPGVPTEAVTTPSSRELLEDIMSTPIEQETRPTRRSWLVAAVAAVALVVIVAGGYTLFAGDDGEPAAQAPPLVLDGGAGDSMASCIVFSVDELAKAPVAFEGTVTSIEGETVTLTVDEWFKGGDAATVEVRAPAGLEALIGSIPFAEGDQFLITAYDGTVNYCGFSGPSTAEFRAAFEEAFGG